MTGKYPDFLGKWLFFSVISGSVSHTAANSPSAFLSHRTWGTWCRTMSSTGNKGDSSGAVGACEIQSKAAKKKCVPCESLDPSALLGRDDVEKALSTSLPLWEITQAPGPSGGGGASKEDPMMSFGLAVSRKFTAKNFQCALDALNGMGAIAEREGHHPDFHLTSYREVEVVLYTHTVGGVTSNDLDLARMLDAEVDVAYSPKWLREHPEAKKE